MSKHKFLRRISFLLILALFVGLLLPAIPVSAAQPALTQGQKNIVKRARQMTEIQWTPQKDIVGWDWGLTYRAGVTYKGLPYGQPVNTSYVPWDTNLEGFLDAVNNPNSLMYTSYSSSNKRAPFYSIDCSAFVSWAWNLGSRQTTHTIAQYATAISTSSYENAQVGDCLNKYAEHVVLITDIGYDSAGAINSIEISESTVNSATNYCCQVVRYGVGGSKTLSEFKTKYFGNGYTLYRSKTRDSVTYEHSCSVPLEGDVCAACGIGGYLTECVSYPCAVNVFITEDCCPYTQPCNPTTASNLGYVSEKLTDKPISEKEVLVADALYENTEGNYWYRVTLSDGTKAYLYNTHTECYTMMNPWVEAGSFPGSITGTTNLQGTVMSGGSRLDTVQAIVRRQESGSKVLESERVTVNATTYPLKNSTVDKTTVFGDLARYGAGNYTLVIQAAYTNCYAQNNTLESLSMRNDAATYDFYYGIPAHTCDKGTYVRQQTAHPHYSEYECSVCGEIWTATDEPNYWDSCTECTPTEPPVDQTIYCGIDVSHHQGAIDWDAVAPNIDFAIVRCGYGDDMTSQDDRYWKENADACTRLGIPFGVYLMSYAVTDDQARSEAQHVLRLIEGYDLTLPIYLDLEDTKYILPNCSKEDILRHAQIFCDMIEEAGYQAGVYANYNWWTNYLTDPAYDQWSRWIARYASATGYDKDYDMWQYSETGSVPGISGNVDLDYWYGALPGTEHVHSYDASVTKPATCTDDGVITYTCRCGDTYTERIKSTGHDYLLEYVAADCVTPGHTVYTCIICADTYVVYDDSGAWSEEKPNDVDDSLIETKTQYRYSEYETTTSYESNMPGWDLVGSSWLQSENGSISYVKNWPSGFLTSHSLYSAYNKSPKSASETNTDRTVINSDNTTGYLYYHWCRGTYQDGPINRGSRSTKQGEFTAFHAFYSTTNPSTLTADSDGSVIHSNGDCCKDSYWYFHTPVNTQTYTTYRNLFTYEHWTDWSDWSDTAYTPSETRMVETRTVYRVIRGELGHSFGDWVVIRESTASEEGIEERTCIRCGHTEQRSIPKVSNPFTDVTEGAFYYQPVMWAVENGITTGISATTFGPGNLCMRAHVVTFLWRAAGSPEPESSKNPFVDVKESDFYYKAVLWAVEKGVTTGLDSTHFGPTAYCNRAQVVTFLWRAQGKPNTAGTQIPFTDVSPDAFYVKPVLWAVENGITTGMSATVFGISEICNRAQIVTFLYRTYN